MALNIFLGVLIWRILGKQKRDTDFSYYFALLWLYVFPPESFCFEVTLKLRNNRSSASQVTFIAQIIPQNEKLLTRARLHFGVGNHCQWKPSRDVASTSPEPFMEPELNYQSDHWPAKIVSFPPSFTPLTLGKLI